MSWSALKKATHREVRSLYRYASHPRMHLVLGWGAALLGLTLVLRNVDLEQVWRTLVHTSPTLVLVVGLMSMTTYLATALRWRLLFPDAEAPRVRSLFKVLMVAQLVNTGLPGRLGMLSRVYLVSRFGYSSPFFVMCTVLLEKVLEGVSLVPFAMLVLFLLALPQHLSRSVRLASGVAIIAGTSLIFFFVVGRLALQSGITERLERFRSLKRFQQVFTTIREILDQRYWPQLWGWSLMIWLAIVVMNYLALLALDVHVSFVAAVALLVVLQVGGRIPAPVAGIGVFHYLAFVTLSLFGVNKEAALSFGVLMHAITYLLPSLIGAWFLWKGEGIRLELWSSKSLMGPTR